MRDPLNDDALEREAEGVPHEMLRIYLLYGRVANWPVEFEVTPEVAAQIDRIDDACDELERGMESKDN